MSMKLVILGLLLEGDKHPYEVQHIMKERQMDCYIKYAKGSLYYAFEQLEKQGQFVLQLLFEIRIDQIKQSFI